MSQWQQMMLGALIIGAACFMMSLRAAHALENPTASPWSHMRILDILHNGFQDPRMTYMRSYGRTTPPPGHVEFCQHEPGECRADASHPAAIRLTRYALADLQAINNLVNKMVKPRSDQQIYKREEVWAIPDQYGDCEDYVLLKRRLLHNRGWPVSVLLVTVVKDEAGEGHAVLTVRTDRGDLILDNKTDRIKLWSQTAYQFFKRQSQDNPRRWINLWQPGTNEVQTSTWIDQQVN